MNGVDDLGVIDPPQIHGGDPEIRVPELTLDHDQRHAFTRHLDRVRMPQLVRCEPSPDARSEGRVAQLDSDAGC
jgi:hypothetical protein